MALKCTETDEDCTKEKKAYAVAHPVVGVGFVISEHVLDRIPPLETHADPCRRFREGLNVHILDGSSGRITPNGYVDVYRPGAFMFAILRQTAQAYLPKTLALIDEAAERRKDEN